MSRSSVSRRVTRLERDRRAFVVDALAAEEPLEIRAGATTLGVTMRTPGHDFELVAGFLHAEGIAAGSVDIAAMRYCVDGEQHYNVVSAELSAGTPAPERPLRATVTTSACGLCGAESIEAVRRASRYDVRADATQVSPSSLRAMADAMREGQRTFDRTGGLHAAALFSPDAELVCLREDVGRHNALDKVVGRRLLDGALPLSGQVVVVSGRASFELVQKAAVAGAPVLAAISAASSLAVELAAESGLTLIGFLRDESMNVYTHPERVT